MVMDTTANYGLPAPADALVPVQLRYDSGQTRWEDAAGDTTNHAVVSGDLA